MSRLLQISLPAKPPACGLPITEEFARLYPLRILVAEDDYTTRRVMKMVLHRLGYHPRVVENGAECLHTALHESFDLVISDIDMPEMDGLECARSIREAGLTLQMIGMSSNKAASDREYCRKAGMNRFLGKPFNVEALQQALYESWDAFSRKKPSVAVLKMHGRRDAAPPRLAA